MATLSRLEDNLRQRMEPFRIDHQVQFDKLALALEEIWSEARQPGWDSHDAQPVHVDAHALAQRVIQSLPTRIPAPELSAEPDGQITLEWYRSPTQVLSVSIDPNGSLHYAALMGGRTAYGTEPFYGGFPAILADLACRITSP